MKNIEKKIDECIKNEEYFLRFEELYVYFDENNISYNDRKEILEKINEHNKKMYSKEKDISREIKNINNQKQDVKKSSISRVIEIEPKSETKVEPLQCDVSEYFDKINDSKNIDEIISLLPDREDSEFDNILSVILVKLYSQKVEVLNFMKEYKEDVRELFEEELSLIDEKIETILDYKNQKEVEEIKTCKENKVVFLKNSFGEPVIFQHLKGCEEYYDSFLELFNSIIDGSFKNLGTYTNNQKVSGLYKVKLFKTRILFSRIGEDVFVVLAAFTKKCDTNLRHQNLLENISSAYQIQKETLSELIKDEKALSKEEEYKDNLIYMLKNKKKVKMHELN